jgi:hypothetical protein
LEYRQALGWSHSTVPVGQDFAQAGASASGLSPIFLVTMSRGEATTFQRESVAS